MWVAGRPLGSSNDKRTMLRTGTTDRCRPTTRLRPADSKIAKRRFHLETKKTNSVPGDRGLYRTAGLNASRVLLHTGPTAGGVSQGESAVAPERAHAPDTSFNEKRVSGDGLLG